MAKFSSDVLLAAEVEIRVNEQLKRDLAKAKADVQATTDAMTRSSIKSMKDRVRANMRTTKLEQQQTVRGIQRAIAADSARTKQIKQTASEQKKIASQQMRSEREIAKQSREATHRIGKMSSAYRMLGVQVAIAGAIVTATFGFMLNEFIKFDRSMRKATAVTTFNLQQYTQMAAMAEDASIRLNVAATNTADAFYFLGSAGLSAEEQMKAFIPVVTLAKAAVIDAGQAAEIMVDTMKGFKIPFEETAHVAAVMAKSVISSNMNFLQLGETLSLVAGVARSTNNTLEETAAMIQLMANVGIKGTRAGTTLRRSMLNLSAPSKKITVLFQNLSLSIEDQSGKIKPYIQLLGEISSALRNATEGQKMLAFKTLFGARAIAGQIELFDAGSIALMEMVLQLKLAGDTHEEIAEKQLKAFGEQIGSIQKGINNLSRQISSKFVPSLKIMAGWIEKSTKNLTEFNEKHKMASSVITGTGLAMGGLLTIFGSMLTVLSSLALVAIGLEKSFLALLGTVGLISIVVLAAVATLVYFITIIAKVISEQKELTETVKGYRKELITATKANREYISQLNKMKSTPEMDNIKTKMSEITEKISLATQELAAFTHMAEHGNVDSDFVRKKLIERELPVPTKKTSIMRRLGGAEKTIFDPSTGLANLTTQARKLKSELEKTYANLRKELERVFKETPAGIENLQHIWTSETVEEVVGMFDDIRGNEVMYTKFALKQIDIRQDAEFKAFKAREIMSSKNRALLEGEFKNLQKLQKQQEEMDIKLEAAGRGENFVRGFKAQMNEISRNMKTVGQSGIEMATTVHDAMSTAFERLIKEGGNFKDIMLGFATEIGNAFIRIAANQFAAAAMSSAAASRFGGILSGAGSLFSPRSTAVGPGQSEIAGEMIAHGGGLVGISAFPTRQLSASTFAGAPRLHDGLRSDEFPAILQRGERVIPKNKSGGSNEQPNVILNFEDRTDRGITPTQGRTVFDGRNFVTNIILEDSVNFGPLKQQGVIR